MTEKEYVSRIGEIAQELVLTMRERVSKGYPVEEDTNPFYCQQSLADVYGNGWAVILSIHKCKYEKEKGEKILELAVMHDINPYKSDCWLGVGKKDKIMSILNDDNIFESVAKGIRRLHAHLEECERELRIVE